jgi:hypothetical protein
VKESSIFTHGFNFDTRDDGTSDVMILTTQTELHIQSWNHFQKFQDKNAGC